MTGITKKIVVYDLPWYDMNIPAKLSDFIEFWQQNLDNVPAPYRDSAEIEIEVRESYGDFLMYFILTYIRPETDEEAAQRKAALIAKREEQEAREKATLEALLKKYPGTNA